MANLYYKQDKYEQAEQLYQRALAISERALGPDHLDMATGLHNLAVLIHTDPFTCQEQLYQCNCRRVRSGQAIHFPLQALKYLLVKSNA